MPGEKASAPGPLEDVLHALCEETAGEALSNLVVDGNGVLEARALHDVQNWGKRLLVHDCAWENGPQESTTENHKEKKEEGVI